MPKYIFQLETLDVHNQRGKKGDVYVASFGVEVGGRAFGPLGRQIGGLGHVISSGDHVELGMFPPDNPPSKWGAWVVGPLEISAADIVSVDYTFVNTADYSGLSNGDNLKIVSAAFGAAIGAGAAAAPATSGASVPLAIAAGVVAVLGEIAGDLLSDSPPKCNGVAFANKITFTGKELDDQVNAAGGTLVSTNFSTNPDIPKDCGHPSGADISFVVVSIPKESVKLFLGRNHDLSIGIKKSMDVVPPVSLRSLIEG
jgi:hypothetical protein